MAQINLHAVSSTDAARVQDALGKTLGLTDTNGVPRPATPAEVDQYVQDYLNRMVQSVELAANVAAVPTPPPVTFV